MIKPISTQLGHGVNHLVLRPESFRAVAEALEKAGSTYANFLEAVDLLEREARKLCSICAAPAARRKAGQPYYWETCANCREDFDHYLRRLYREQN